MLSLTVVGVHDVKLNAFIVISIIATIVFMESILSSAGEIVNVAQALEFTLTLFVSQHWLADYYFAMCFSL